MLRSTAFALAITALSGTVLAETTRQLSDAEWLEDIDAYVGMMREIHLNPFHTISEADWLAEVDALRANSPTSPSCSACADSRR